MHNRTTFFAVAALSSACMVSSFAGCSSSSGNNNPTPDSGTESDTGTSADTGSTDSSTTGEGSTADTGTAPTPDGGDAGAGLNCNTGTAPTGTPILASTSASVQGLVGNDTVLFFDTSGGGSLNSVPITGGTPTAISSYDNSGLLISGNVVLWSHAPVAATASAPTYGPLLSSVSGGVGKTLSLDAYYSGIGGGFVDVSSDGSLVLYMTTAAPATTANIVVSAPDGTGAVTLVSNVLYVANANGTLCAPNARFVGNSVVAAYCTTAPTNQLSATIAQYKTTGGAPTQTFTTAGFYGFTIDNPKTPTQIAYTTAAGQYVRSLTVGASPTLIDPIGVGGATFSADGLSLIYYEFVANDAGTGGTGGIYRSTIATPSPKKIAAGLFGGTLSVSADTNWLVTYEQVNSTGTLTDMYLVSTAAGSSLQTLCPTQTGTFFGDNFTVDDTQVLFFCNVAGGVGDFDAEKLMTGATATTVDPATVWQENAVSGAKVLYNNNWIQPAGNKVFGYADIHAQDLSTSAAATTVVSHADANYYVTADKTKLVYSFSSCSNQATPGIYVIPAP